MITERFFFTTITLHVLCVSCGGEPPCSMAVKAAPGLEAFNFHPQMITHQ
jgi:hypothetical protein